MNKWVVIPIIIILTIVTITNGYFNLQESDKLEEAQSEIAALDGDVFALEAYDRAVVIDVVAILEPSVVRIEALVQALY